MNIEKSKNAKEAIEFFRTLFKGNVIIDGINLSEDTIQELIMDKLETIENEYINLNRELNNLKKQKENLENENWDLTTRLNNFSSEQNFVLNGKW